jgi:hypothetical protein
LPADVHHGRNLTITSKDPGRSFAATFSGFDRKINDLHDFFSVPAWSESSVISGDYGWRPRGGIAITMDSEWSNLGLST